MQADAFFRQNVTDIDGNTLSFESFRGSRYVVLINVASECGMTDSGYREFKELTEQGIDIVAFPCNQFGAQEPGTHQEIKTFAQGYELRPTEPGSHFYLTRKVNVNGKHTFPLWKLLKLTTRSGDVEWNFHTKFVVVCGSTSCDISRHDGVSIRNALESVTSTEL